MNNISENANPYEAGLPVAFVYTQPNHPDSFMIHQKGADNCCTSNFGQLAEHAKGLGKVVFLTREQMKAMFSPFEAEERCRPFTPEEQRNLLDI